MKTLTKCVLIFCLMIISIPMTSTLFACGLITHIEISQRAHWFFNSQEYPEYTQYVSEHQEALQAGSVFPDWGYSFGYHDESEEAHWDPFIIAAADYIHRTYPKPWGEETEKLAVFILGLMSHSMADLTWHNLSYAEEGFLEVMGHQDFYGSFSSAHDYGDFGGDVLCAYELDLSWINTSWYVPVKDMANIYNEMGYDRVTPEILTTYTYLLFIGAHAEKLGAGLLFPISAADSPFIVEQFQDYFVGGLDEMAISSAFRFHDVIDWMENGPLKSNSPLNILLAEKDSAKDTNDILSVVFDMFITENMNAIVEETERGVLFRLDSSPLTTDINPNSNLPLLQSSQVTLPSDKSVSITNGEPYSYLGTGLTAGDYNSDGMDDLAIGAPGFGLHGHPQLGKVYIVNGKQDIQSDDFLDLSDGDADRILNGDYAFGRFGWSLTTVDLNSDGLDDLAVSSPTFGSQDLSFSGRVFVYFGGQNGLSADPDLIITADEKHTNLGWRLSAGDCNADNHDDLIIASPYARASGVQRGLVGLFLSSPEKVSGTAYSIEDADWIALGENDYDWFGYHTAYMDNNLLVGAPTANTGDIQSTGKLYGYDLADINHLETTHDTIFTIRGTEAFEKFASYFAFGDPYGNGETIVAISSPTKDLSLAPQAGIITLLSLEGLHGDLRVDEVSKIATFRGSHSNSRFGSRLQFFDYNQDGIDDLWAAEPFYGLPTEALVGSVYMWAGGNQFPKVSFSIPAILADKKIIYSGKNSRFGTVMESVDINGDGHNDLAVSAVSASTSARLSGSVHIYMSTDDSSGCFIWTILKNLGNVFDVNNFGSD